MSPSRCSCLRIRTLLISLCLIVLAAFWLWAGFHLSVAAREAATDKLVRKSQRSAGAGAEFSPCGTAVVTNSNDSGAGSLRDAIINACSGDTISFDMSAGHVTSPITLTSGELLINKSLTIQGPGAGTLTISGNNSSRVFEISLNQTASLSGLTIANGQVAASNGTNKGGGILNAGNLTIDGCTISNNTSTGNGSINFAGGIFNDTGALNITNSTVSGNSATGGCSTEGGGIANGGTLTITTSTISNNSVKDAAGCGGVNSGAGIFNEGTLSLTSSTVSGNAASSISSYNDAGGIFNAGNTTVTNSTLAGNSVTGSTDSYNGGGGIYNISNRLVIVNSTLSGNFVNGGFNQGGGVFTGGGSTLIISSSTISGNSASNGNSNTGGGIIASNGTGNLRNTIVSGNSASVGPDVSGPFTSQGNNLIGAGDDSTGFINGVNNDQVGSVASPIDALLAALGNNGGPTQTHALLSGSPALDAGNNCVANPAHCGDSNITQQTTDQRGPGFNRIVDGPDADTTATVDIGAYESQVLPTLADLPDTSTNEDTQLTVGFDCGDPSTILSVTASSSNSTLVANDAAHLSTGMNGSVRTVTINPVTNANGTTNITVTVNRTGGPESKTFLLTVNPVNDAPSFTRGADQTVNEDSGPQTVNSWASSISPGPANETAQTVIFNILGNTNAALFSASPAVSSTGTLTYTPAANMNGSATITLTAQDNGGTANDGADTSPSQTFTITVNPVADTPSVTNATTIVNTQTTSGLVISRNAADGSEVTHFKITNIQNGSLFKNDGTTPILANSFITFAEGNAGLKFTPSPNLASPGTTFKFDVQASLSNSDAGLGGGTATASITVNCGSTIVTNSNNSGAGSLRDTIGTACVGSTITFDMTAGHVTSPINLLSTIGVTKNLTIQGPGASLLNIAGNFNFVLINADVSAGADLSISGLTLSKGANVFGTRPTAIQASHAATLTVRNCEFQNNSGTPASSAVIYASQANALIIDGCTFDSNGSFSTVLVDRTPLTVTNSTFNGDSTGSAIRNAGTGTLVINSTIANNAAGIISDNVLCDGCSVDMTVKNNLLSSNSGKNLQRLGTAALTSGGNNLTDDSTSSAFSNSDPTNIIVPAGGAKLSTLAQNGGLTRTMALLAGSPAINAGNNGAINNPPFAGPPFTDQRGSGFSRIIDSTTDIGAFEAQVFLDDISDKTINEDSPLSFNFSVGGAITTVSATSSNTAVIPNNSANLAVSGSGSPRILNITPPANVFGQTTITVTVSSATGQTMTDTFLLTINSVNDAPSFTKGANQTVNEDATTQTVTNWATNISAGPANESTQTLSFTVTNDNNALFQGQPAVSSTGVLTYRPAANANGSATVSVVLHDNGGTANGGVDASPAQTFTMTVNPVNDPPNFTVGANQTIKEDAAAQSIANWATNISAGPADESAQIVTFTVANNNNSLFSAQPAVSATGTLTYTAAANANGSATVTVTAKDNGGTANGGVDTSAPQTFTITVNSVNDAPSFTKSADQSANNNAGAQTIANWATNISAGPSDESSQTVTFQVIGNTSPGLFTAGPAISSNGTLTYTPSSNGGGTATITINLKDNGGTANGGVDTSASQSFTITVTPVGGFVNFASSTANTAENSGSTTVNVVRTGDTSKAVTVTYATNPDAGVPCSTANGIASPKCDFTAALGTLSFAAGETSKTITILINQDSFVEVPEVITLTLSSPGGGAALGTPATMAVTIADDASEPPTNVIDDASTFVRMHYHDFLNREGDQSGIDFWTGQMSNCGNPDLTVCRVNVSGAFFLSIEFQQTGYLVERMYKTAYGDATATSTFGGSHQIFVPVVRANEFLMDTQRIGRGVVVLQPGWETVLENNKQAYALEFVQTSRFITAFPTSMTPAQFVDNLNQNAGNVLSPSERQTAINLFGNVADTTYVNARAQALRQIAENQTLYNAEFNRAFVLSQYIGYLRRNPNDLPDSDYTGFDFWFTKLNQFNGDYIKAEMVKAFISSSEYRQRFGP